MTKPETVNVKKRIAVTMGDPAGVGPELCCRLLADHQTSQQCTPIVFGDANVLRRVADRIGISAPSSVIDSKNTETLRDIDTPFVFHIPGLDIDALQPGKVNANTGELSMRYITTAIDAALQGAVDGVATGPINKTAWHAAGIRFPGHTELFAERFQTDRFCMMMTAPSFSCSLVTTHIGYHEVPANLEIDRIVEVIELTYDALQKIYDRQPTLVALGLNPHAGENGLFGNREEERLIQPAIDRAASKGIVVKGPLPPDTPFLAPRRQATDRYICMYHDQGLIPFKALNFDTGVNITLGLPIVRTSVDHGTALDIAWQGKAEVSSFIAATQLAARLAK